MPAGGSPWLGDELAPGDEIVLVEASGLHANGASLARRLASQLPLGWTTPLPNGRPYGEAVLDPGALYAGLVAVSGPTASPSGTRATSPATGSASSCEPIGS